MIVNFHLPGLRQNYPLNMLILNLLKTKPDWFREGVRIASFFGEFPTSLWNGGVRQTMISVMPLLYRMLLKILMPRECR